MNVIVRGDGKTKYKQIRAVLDICQQANLVKVDLATEIATNRSHNLTMLPQTRNRKAELVEGEPDHFGGVSRHFGGACCFILRRGKGCWARKSRRSPWTMVKEKKPPEKPKEPEPPKVEPPKVEAPKIEPPKMWRRRKRPPAVGAAGGGAAGGGRAAL